MDNTEIRFVLLACFAAFIPLSALCYALNRSKQRRRELERYVEILRIDDKQLFEQRFPGLSFFLAVLFVTVLSAGYWALILFGSAIELGDEYRYLLGSFAAQTDPAQVADYQSGALLTFNMAFLGAFLWGIQSIARRYAMNDLIPIAYYSLSVRMIFASILALTIYHLSEALPLIIGSLIGANIDSSTPGSVTADTADRGDANAHLVMPVFAFLIGMFPQRGLKWLTDRFPLFAEQPDPSKEALPLEMIEGITSYDRLRLQELGIDSCYDLANEDYVPSLFKTPFSPRRLINWILQAKMCVYFGRNVRELRKHGIHTVWQFEKCSEESLKELARNTPLTEDTLLMVKRLIVDDSEITRLIEAQQKLSRYWNKLEPDTVQAVTDEGPDADPTPTDQISSARARPKSFT